MNKEELLEHLNDSMQQSQQLTLKILETIHKYFDKKNSIDIDVLLFSIFQMFNLLLRNKDVNKKFLDEIANILGIAQTEIRYLFSKIDQEGKNDSLN